jgi:DNA-directed RNA polymerase specialized sigma24 family protein
MSLDQEPLPTGETVLSDEVLVQRCLARDELAWCLLFQRHHRRLVGVVIRLLGRGPGHEQLAEDVASRVWLLLLAENYRRLRAYNPERGRLSTYLACLARGQITEVLRAEARQRRQREGLAEQTSLAIAPHLSLATVLDEFLPRLSPAEKDFLEKHLLSNPTTPTPITPAGQPKRKQRVRRKFDDYLDPN